VLVHEHETAGFRDYGLLWIKFNFNALHFFSPNPVINFVIAFHSVVFCCSEGWANVDQNGGVGSFFNDERPADFGQCAGAAVFLFSRQERALPVL